MDIPRPLPKDRVVSLVPGAMWLAAGGFRWVRMDKRSFEK